jgi:hypothetical protein
MPPYIPLPYASDQPAYSNRDYTLKQMQLLEQQAAREAAYERERGTMMAGRWAGLGGLATETLGSLVQSRDLRAAKAEAQRRYDAEQAENQRRYDIQERRAAAVEAQQQIDRDKANARFDYGLVMSGPSGVPLSQSQQQTLAQVNPGAMVPLTRERDEFVATEAPAPVPTEELFANTLRRGITGEKRGPAAPLFGGGIGTERVTEQYGVGRRPTAAEEEQAADNKARTDAARAAAASANTARVLAAKIREEDIATATATRAQAQRNFETTNARISAAEGRARNEQSKALPSGVQSYIASLASGGTRNGVTYPARTYDKAKDEVLRAWPTLSATHKGIDLPTVLATLDKLYGLASDPVTGERTRWNAVVSGNEQ